MLAVEKTDDGAFLFLSIQIQLKKGNCDYKRISYYNNGNIVIP